MEYSLIVTFREKEIFTSMGRWLYPLFDLENFLDARHYPPDQLILTEKVAGQAAAFLIVRLGIRKCHVRLISEKGIAVFDKFGVDYTFDEKVTQIQCRTEHILMQEMSPDEAWQVLRRRAGRVHGADLIIEKLEVNINGNSIINGLDLSVHRGEGLIITGENGAGKTTLLKAILGLTKINSGTIRISDLQVGSQIWKRIRHITGYVNQERTGNLFPVKASEVVEIGLAGRRLSRSVRRERVESAMTRTGCIHLAGHSFHKLSGGEKQRVSIARCLCQQARILLFDEPTTFLDPASKADLRRMLKELWKEEAPTIVVVSHDDEWTGKFDWEIKTLHRGKIC